MMTRYYDCRLQSHLRCYIPNRRSIPDAYCPPILYTFAIPKLWTNSDSHTKPDIPTYSETDSWSQLYSDSRAHHFTYLFSFSPSNTATDKTPYCGADSASNSATISYSYTHSHSRAIFHTLHSTHGFAQHCSIKTSQFYADDSPVILSDESTGVV